MFVLRYLIKDIYRMSFNSGIKYDAEKEERQLQEARQRELQRIEETKQKAAEKGVRRFQVSCGDQ